MANFTPQQIEEFLQEFFNVVGARQYVGARYVPIFGRAGEATVEWDDLAPYEPLTVVMHLGVSYVSRRYVPRGISIFDSEYWVETYRFNAQVEQYRQEVLGFQGQIDDRVPYPDDPHSRYGTEGQVLGTLTDGNTQWVDPVIVTTEIAAPLIEGWLDDHPEATTTVQDDSVSDAKLVQSGGVLSRVTGEVFGRGYADHLIQSELIGVNLMDGATVTPRDASKFATINANEFVLQQLTTGSNYVNISVPVVMGEEYVIQVSASNPTQKTDYYFVANPVTTPTYSDTTPFTNVVRATATNPYLLITVGILSTTPDTTLNVNVIHADGGILPGIYDYVDDGFAPIRHVNLIDPDAVTDNVYVSYSNGSLSANTSFVASDFIPVTAGARYSINVGVSNAGIQQMAFYKADRTFLSGLANSGVLKQATITAPANAAYLRWSILKANFDTTIITEGPTPLDYVPYSVTKIPPEYIPVVENVIHVGTGYAYQTILRGLKAATEGAEVIVHEGTYDMAQEYIDYYGSGFWDDYTGYAGISDEFYAGYWVQNCKLTFLPRSKVVFNNTYQNTAIASYFSVFATAENAEIDGATVEFSNLRYAIHDDYAELPGHTRFANCTFTGTPYANAVIGAGCRNNNTYLIENCVFLGNNGLHDISYHNSSGSTAKNHIVIRNCYGSRRCAFRWMGNSQQVTVCVVSACHFGEIVCQPYDSSAPYENMALYAFSNETGA